MSDYETLNDGPICKTIPDANGRILYNLRLNPDVIDESSFKEFIKGVDGLNIPVIDDPSFEMFDILECPNCPNNSEIMTTDDGNRNQTCLSCKTVLMRDGKLVNQTENKSEMCDCPKGTIKYAVLKLDKNGNQLCVDCNKIEKLKGNTTTQQKVNNPGFSSFMPDHMQDYMKELYDIHCRIHNINQNQKKDDGELEIYSENDPNMPDYMKELSELVKQKK